MVVAAAAGISNSLADSTTDITATEQESSAYVFHKVGDSVVAQTVSYALNGNTIASITNAAGTALAATDYTVADGVVTFTAEYLGSLYTATDAAGTKETLTVAFSAGASLSVTIVLWDTPTVATDSFVVDPSTDLNIPVSWNGLHRVAAVKARKADGTYLSDDWTEYLPALQQGYWTFGSWGYDDKNIIVYASGLTAIQAAGQAVTLTFEVSPSSVVVHVGGEWLLTVLAVLPSYYGRECGEHHFHAVDCRWVIRLRQVGWVLVRTICVVPVYITWQVMPLNNICPIICLPTLSVIEFCGCYGVPRSSLC